MTSNRPSSANGSCGDLTAGSDVGHRTNLYSSSQSSAAAVDRKKNEILSHFNRRRFTIHPTVDNSSSNGNSNKKKGTRKSKSELNIFSCRRGVWNIATAHTQNGNGFHKTCDQQQSEPKSPGSSGSWIRRNIMGRTPSLPSSLGKKKHYFFKKFQSRKASAPSFAPSTAASPQPPSEQQSRLGGGQQQPHDAAKSSPGAASRLMANTTEAATQLPDPGGQCVIGSSRVSRKSPRNPPFQHAATSDGDSSGGSGCWSGEGGGGAYSSFVECQECSLYNNREMFGISPEPGNYKVDCLSDATELIDELRSRLKCRGHQIVGCKKRMKQQEECIARLRQDQSRQLEEISAQLLIFEASLRAKERSLQETLSRKETIISKQQKVIKHLIKKGLGSAVISAGGANNRKSSGGDTNQDNRLPLKSSSLYARRTGEASELLLLDTSSAPGTISPGGTAAIVGGQKARQGRYQRVSSIKSDPDYASDAQNDSDSAIMLEDHVGEVSLSVPNLRAINGSSVLSSVVGSGSAGVGSDVPETPTSSSAVVCDLGGGLQGCEEIIACTNGGNVIKIIRSVSDVVKIRGQAAANGQQQPVANNSSDKASPGGGGVSLTLSSIGNSRQKSKEERRLNNRQKLLSLKRHSGFHLKRPEILETVYSVEEDGTDPSANNASGNTQSGGGGGSYAPSSAAAVSSEPVEPVDTQETQSAPATANASVVLGPAFPKLTNPREPSRGQPIQLSQLKSSAENSPSGSRRSSSGPDNVGSAVTGCVLTGYRVRRDSEQTANTYSDFETTDDEDETTRGGMNTTSCTTGDETPGTSCSCSRRSSYALTDNSDCVCLQCTAGRIAVVTTLKGGVSASAPASRRSSAGTGVTATPPNRPTAPVASKQQPAAAPVAVPEAVPPTHIITPPPVTVTTPPNSSTPLEDPNATKNSSTTGNRHKDFNKPKDVKFKRISKAKSRSLEELRDKLRHHPPPTSSQHSPTAGIRSLFDSCSGGVYSCGDSSSCAEEELMNNGPNSANNSLSLLRGYLDRHHDDSSSLTFGTSTKVPSPSVSERSQDNKKRKPSIVVNGDSNGSGDWICEPETIITKC